MPKITYQEIRPGKWFRLVDGQIVAAATPSEVAAWRRDNAAPPGIWQDVLKTARPAARPEDRSEATSPQGSQQDSFWKDIVKSTKTAPRVEPRVAPAEDRMRGLRPRGKEDIDIAEQASIWRDVLNQSKKKAPPAPAPVGNPPVKAKEAEKLAPTKPVSPRTPEPVQAEAAEHKAATKVAPAEKPSPTGATAPRKLAARQAAKKTAAAATPVKARKPEKPKSSPTLPEKSTSTAVRVKPVVPAKKRVVGVKKPPAPKPESPEKPRQPQVRAQTPKPAAPSRKTSKGKTTPQPSSPLYLWMVAGQSDDLLATVRAGLTRYQQRFDRAAEVVFCHSEDLPALEGGKLPVDVREAKSLPRRNVWIGSK